MHVYGWWLSICICPVWQFVRQIRKSMVILTERDFSNRYVEWGYSTSHCHYREKLSKRFATNVLILQMGLVKVNRWRFLSTSVLCWKHLLTWDYITIRNLALREGTTQCWGKQNFLPEDKLQSQQNDHQRYCRLSCWTFSCLDSYTTSLCRNMEDMTAVGIGNTAGQNWAEHCNINVMLLDFYFTLNFHLPMWWVDWVHIKKILISWMIWCSHFILPM